MSFKFLKKQLKNSASVVLVNKTVTKSVQVVLIYRVVLENKKKFGEC